jgi:hypothetical protein
MCEAGDVLGWRVDGDPVLPYDSMDDGLTRISRSPILKPDLGRTEPFPFSVARTYSIQVTRAILAVGPVGALCTHLRPGCCEGAGAW